MVSERLDGIIASCKVCVVDRDVYVSVTGVAQDDRPTRVASLELLSTLTCALHLPGARSRQEMVAGEPILLEEPAAQLASALGAVPRVRIAWRHSEIIRVVFANGPHRRLPGPELQGSCRIEHEYGGTTVLTEGAEVLGLAESLAKAYPDGLVYIHVEYIGDKE
jgi:hypothetical protein